MTIYLYIKTHLDTGLKYFGKTTKDNLDTYHGSGKKWKNHLKKHGTNVETKIYFSSEDISEVETVALDFSIKNNIVESKEWANLKYENGRDGGTQSEWITEKTKRKMSENRKGKPSWFGKNHSKETREVMSYKAKLRCERDGAPKGAFKKGNKAWNKGVPIDESQKEKFRETLKKTSKICEHCGKNIPKGSYTRFHGDNCKKRNNDEKRSI